MMWLAIAWMFMIASGNTPAGSDASNVTVWTLLVTHPGPNLEQLPPGDQARIAREFCGAPSRTGDRWQPRRFWRLPTRDRYLLLVRSQLLFVPGDSRIRAVVFDKDGRVLSSTEFSTGWRYAQLAAELSNRVEIGAVVTVRCSGCWYCRQYYGISANGLYLLRLEGEDGVAVRNPYVAPNFIVGPEVLFSARDAARNLEGNDAVLRLATLAWLGAKHLDLKKAADQLRAGGFAPDAGTVKQANAVRLARGSARVRGAIAKLTKSADAWSREGAIAARNPKDGDASFGNVDDPLCTCPRGEP